MSIHEIHSMILNLSWICKNKQFIDIIESKHNTALVLAQEKPFSLWLRLTIRSMFIITTERNFWRSLICCSIFFITPSRLYSLSLDSTILLLFSDMSLREFESPEFCNFRRISEWLWLLK